MRLAVSPRVSIVHLLVVYVIVGTGAEQSGDGRRYDALADKVTQLESTVSERLTAGEQRDQWQSKQTEKLKRKFNSASAARLSEQINNLAVKVENSTDVNNLKKEAEILTLKLNDLKSKAMWNHIEKFTAQLDQKSERLKRAEPQTEETVPEYPRDCSDVWAESWSDVFFLRSAISPDATVLAWCDVETDGGNWTTILRRIDMFTREDFYRGWADYRNGFGNVRMEFWWGLKNVWALTSQKDRQYELRVDLEDDKGQKRYATYQNFSISSEADGYRLTVTDYAGDAGDSLSMHSGQRFSTKDRDYGSRRLDNCARKQWGGWWFNSSSRGCGKSNLNGRCNSGTCKYSQGTMRWDTFRNDNSPLAIVTMNIRPTTKTE